MMASNTLALHGRDVDACLVVVEEVVLISDDFEEWAGDCLAEGCEVYLLAGLVVPRPVAVEVVSSIVVDIVAVYMAPMAVAEFHPAGSEAGIDVLDIAGPGTGSAGDIEHQSTGVDHVAQSLEVVVAGLNSLEVDTAGLNNLVMDTADPNNLVVVAAAGPDSFAVNTVDPDSPVVGSKKLSLCIAPALPSPWQGVCRAWAWRIYFMVPLMLCSGVRTINNPLRWDLKAEPP